MPTDLTGSARKSARLPCNHAVPPISFSNPLHHFAFSLWVRFIAQAPHYDQECGGGYRLPVPLQPGRVFEATPVPCFNGGDLLIDKEPLAGRVTTGGRRLYFYASLGRSTDRDTSGDLNGRPTLRCHMAVWDTRVYLRHVQARGPGLGAGVGVLDGGLVRQQLVEKFIRMAQTGAASITRIRRDALVTRG